MAFLKTMFLRKYCTAIIKPPIKVFGIEGRYAAALYSAAYKQKKLDEVEKELTGFHDLLIKDKPLREFIENPTIQRKQKAEALKAIAKEVSLSMYSSNLLQIMAENGRVKKIIPVIKLYKMIMGAHRGEVICEVTTAKTLEGAQMAKLESTLKKLVSANQTIRLTAHVDPKIIGGMIVSVGDRFADMSVRSKILKYTDLMSSPA